MSFEEDFEILKLEIRYLEPDLNQISPLDETLTWIESDEGKKVAVRTIFRINTLVLLGLVSIGLAIAALA